ncbi:MAG TPA: GNAT family N-acetyltransferase [Micromonosporaceae bacterium]|nr:GNAT family N-acetyltransferase [Micromonosporaceae bacterium]
MSDIEIRPTRYLAPVARTLMAAAAADLKARYGSELDLTPAEAYEYDPPSGGFLVAWRDGVPVGCAGWRSHGDAEEVAELKRMYVDPDARGGGVASKLIAAAEASAAERGRIRMILECGSDQPAAAALYERCGYVRIENFGAYGQYDTTLSYGRDLPTV